MLSTNHVKPRAWSVGLSWSHDALRAAAFNLTHGFMAEIGEVLAAYGAPLMRDQGYIPTLIFCKTYVIPLGPGTVP